MEPNTLDTLKRVSAATVTLLLMKRGIRRSAMKGVRPLSPGQPRVVAEAYTLRYIPLREDLSDPTILGAPGYAPRVAIEECPEGSAFVIDARGVSETGVIGDILAERLHQRGVAAVVTDGAMRDGAAVRATGLPVWCAGSAAPASLAEHSAGDLQSPVGCGGVAVIPGDILVCDSDGVAVIPRALADEIARDGLEQETLEGWIQDRVREGRATIGLYPPNAETRAEYEAWRKQND